MFSVDFVEFNILERPPFWQTFYWKFPTFLVVDKKYIYNGIVVNPLFDGLIS